MPENQVIKCVETPPEPRKGVYRDHDPIFLCSTIEKEPKTKKNACGEFRKGAHLFSPNLKSKCLNKKNAYVKKRGRNNFLRVRPKRLLGHKRVLRCAQPGPPRLLRKTTILNKCCARALIISLIHTYVRDQHTSTATTDLQ